MSANTLNTFQQGPHAVLVTGDCDDIARQEFVKSLKGAIQEEMLPVITNAYFQRALPNYAAEHGDAPQDYKAARKAFAEDPLFKAYLSINRSSQELQWFSVIDAI